MFAAILEKIQEKIIQQQYIMTIHADEEMDEDNLMLADVEQAILTGEILECQNESPSCPSCGTSYLTSLTLKEIDRIRRDRAAPTFVDRKTVAVTKSVEVARF